MERVGLLGGTFDPVHDGHLQLALAAKDELRLQRVLLLPASAPPHKPEGAVTSFDHRRQMLKLALAGVDGLEPCFIEGELPVPSYTIDTLRVLQAQDREHVEYLFIIGEDAFAEILSWKAYREVLQRVSLIVARRHGCHHATDRLENIALALGYCPSPLLWTGKQGLKEIHFLHASPPRISSSEIRRSVAAGAPQVAGLHPAVLAYAREHRLYCRPGA